MGNFASFDGTEIWFDVQDDDAERGSVVLLHGFAADTNINYVRPGILDALVDEGFRVVATDFRGHGLSGKPHDPSAYADAALARDVQGLLDHLGLDPVVVVGYSMGAGVALHLGAHDPRVTRVVALGVGAASIARRGETDQPGFADALLADDPESITDPLGKQFRRLADSVRADREALAACMTQAPVDFVAAVDAVTVPVLVVAGADDELAGDPAGVADRVADGRALTVPGNHFDANAQPALQ
ncbi:MAG: alpha/beta hydrolase, partial [Actinobacteria bacterium]|nr:alpha/beta hydrolase [Actinomycetota bacterium]